MAFLPLGVLPISCYNTPMQNPDNILHAISQIRAPLTRSEYDLHALIAGVFDAASIPYRHEALVAPRRRVDFLCTTVAVEIKRGKPLHRPLLRQLLAYAESPMVGSMILVADRAPVLPEAILGKRLFAVSLERLWGIAL